MKHVFVAIVGVLLAAEAASSACDLTDAVQSDSTDTWVTLLDDMQAAQTFQIETASTGTLDKVVLYFAQVVDAPDTPTVLTDTVHVAIYDVVGGLPGTSLAKVSQGFDDWSTAGSFRPGFRTFDFSSFGIDADFDDLLAIVVTMGDSKSSKLSWAGGRLNPYSAGKAYSRESDQVSVWDDIDATPAQTDRHFEVSVCRP